MTIKERLIEIKENHTHDYWIDVFDNTSSFQSPESTGFFISDFDHFKNLGVLDRRLDEETRTTIEGTKCILLGFEGLESISK